MCNGAYNGGSVKDRWSAFSAAHDFPSCIDKSCSELAVEMVIYLLVEANTTGHQRLYFPFIIYLVFRGLDQIRERRLTASTWHELGSRMTFACQPLANCS
jgi:hypothetical protein